MHLLIVDANLARAERLQASLQDRQPDWRVTAVMDIASAKVASAQDECDVALAVNTAKLRAGDILNATREFAPAALRIAALDNGVATRSLIDSGAAHRVKMLPLRTDRLIATIKSIRELDALVENEGLRRRIASVGKIPSAPKVAFDLIRQRTRGWASVALVGKLLHGDPVLTARVLQLSNSAYYSRGTAVAHIDRAVMKLGVDTVINIAIAHEAFAGADSADVQARAIATSQLAAKIMIGMGRADLATTAATAATLVDIGRTLPLRKRRDKIGCADAADGLEYVAMKVPVESAVGAHLLSRWGLPWPIVEAVAYCHNPSLASDEGFGVVAAVHAAYAIINGRALDEAYLESLDAMPYVPHWQLEAARSGGLNLIAERSATQHARSASA